jgi:predicted dehydrogenase
MIYKCIIVGCGRIAGSLDKVNSINPDSIKSHCMSFTLHENIKIVGCVDIELETAKKLAEKYDIDFHSDNLDTALELKPDFISVCTPDSTHFEVVLKILKSDFCPKIIFLEKPAMTSQEDFLQICELSEKVGTKIIVNHSRRFDDNYKSLRDLIISKELGDCIRIDCWYYNGWIHNGVHLVDTLQYLFDECLAPVSFLESDHKPTDASDLNVQGHFLTQNSSIDVFINCMDDSY